MFGFGSSQKRHGISNAKAELKKAQLLAEADKRFDIALQAERAGQKGKAAQSLKTAEYLAEQARSIEI